MGDNRQQGISNSNGPAHRFPLLIISLYFLTGGVAHFVATDLFILSMPEYLNYHFELVIISGVFEILGAIGILLPQSRLLAGYGLMALSVAVFPANINMALHPEQFAATSELLLWLRLPFQLVILWFIWWAIRPERIRRRNEIG